MPNLGMPALGYESAAVWLRSSELVHRSYPQWSRSRVRRGALLAIMTARPKMRTDATLDR